MTKNKQKQKENKKTGEKMQHGVQPSSQHGAVTKLAIASNCDDRD
jgi:hypothetical protein